MEKLKFPLLLLFSFGTLFKTTNGIGFLVWNACYELNQGVSTGKSPESYAYNKAKKMFSDISKVLEDKTTNTWALEQHFQMLRLNRMKEKTKGFGNNIIKGVSNFINNSDGNFKMNDGSDYYELFKNNPCYYLINYVFVFFGIGMIITGSKAQDFSVFAASAYVIFYYLYYIAVSKFDANPFDNRLHGIGFILATLLSILLYGISRKWKAFGALLMAVYTAEVVCWFSLQIIFFPTPDNIVVKLLFLTVEAFLLISIFMCIRLGLGFIISTSAIGSIMIVINTSFALNIFVSFETRTFWDYNPADNYQTYLVYTSVLFALGVFIQLMVYLFTASDRKQNKNFDREMIVL